MNRLTFPKVWRVICPRQNSFAWLLTINLALLSVTYSLQSCKMYPMESESGNLERHALRPGVWQTKHLTKCPLPFFFFFWINKVLLEQCTRSFIMCCLQQLSDQKDKSWVVMIERPGGLQALKSLRKSLWTPPLLLIIHNFPLKHRIFLIFIYLFVHLYK